MPSKQAHLAAADHNQAAIDHLRLRIVDLPDWVVVAAFYKALHLVEAVFAHDGINHAQDHGQRNEILKKTNRYKNLWRNYSPIWQASLVARYLEHVGPGDSRTFPNYLDAKTVESLVLNHYLRQIERTVQGLIVSGQ
jgi:hypothetical protein